MQEVGVVTALCGKEARVQIKRHAACGDCGACQVGREKMTMETMALNRVHASVGEQVIVEMATMNVLGATAIMYGIPLLAFLIGCGIGTVIAGIYSLDAVLVPFFSGIILTVVAYSLIRLFDKRGIFGGKYQPVITKIYDYDEDKEDKKETSV